MELKNAHPRVVTIMKEGYSRNFIIQSPLMNSAIIMSKYSNLENFKRSFGNQGLNQNIMISLNNSSMVRPAEQARRHPLTGDMCPQLGNHGLVQCMGKSMSKENCSILGIRDKVIQTNWALSDQVFNQI